MENTELKSDLLNALCMLKKALKCRDTEDAHNILIDGSYDCDWDNEEECEKMHELMEQELEDYLTKLNGLIEQVRK